MTKFDELENYARRESIIISGKSLPIEVPGENTTTIAVKLIKSKLDINLEPSEISISHRLGKYSQDTSNARPIIVKLLHRSTKYALMDSCIKKRTNNGLSDFFLNESLSTIRTTMYSDLKQVRWSHKSLFKQLYTRDGIIYVKLTVNEEHKYAIKTEDHLLSFLKNYPQLQDTYDNLKSSAES